MALRLLEQKYFITKSTSINVDDKATQKLTMGRLLGRQLQAKSREL